jgi:hypothetical protein
MLLLHRAYIVPRMIWFSGKAIRSSLTEQVRSLGRECSNRRKINGEASLISENRGLLYESRPHRARPPFMHGLVDPCSHQAFLFRKPISSRFLKQMKPELMYYEALRYGYISIYSSQSLKRWGLRNCLPERVIWGGGDGVLGTSYIIPSSSISGAWC